MPEDSTAKTLAVSMMSALIGAGVTYGLIKYGDKIPDRIKKVLGKYKLEGNPEIYKKIDETIDLLQMFKKYMKEKDFQEQNK